MAVGLLGGSFDPAHAGHRAVTLAALRALDLDRVWWVVSPHNPLKDRAPASMERRMARARAVADHPRVEVTDVEVRIGTRYTVDTVRALRERLPGVGLVWLTGADALAGLHRWHDWRGLAEAISIAGFGRPGTRMAARRGALARAFPERRLSPPDARRIAWEDPPAWAILEMPLRAESSTAIRAAGHWAGGTKA